jgi:hypothetical protein
LVILDQTRLLRWEIGRVIVARATVEVPHATGLERTG